MTSISFSKIAGMGSFHLHGHKNTYFEDDQLQKYSSIISRLYPWKSSFHVCDCDFRNSFHKPNYQLLSHILKEMTMVGCMAIASYNMKRFEESVQFFKEQLKISIKSYNTGCGPVVGLRHELFLPGKWSFPKIFLYKINCCFIVKLSRLLRISKHRK